VGVSAFVFSAAADVRHFNQQQFLQKVHVEFVLRFTKKIDRNPMPIVFNCLLRFWAFLGKGSSKKTF
jgi:hypothetical protein